MLNPWLTAIECTQPLKRSSVQYHLLKFGVAFSLLALLVGCTGQQIRNTSLSNNDFQESEEIFKLSAEADRAYVESRWLDAARDYRQLADLVPQDAYAWFRLGNTYTQQGAFSQAIQAYESAIQRNPHQPKPWYNLATVHLLNAQKALRESYEQLRPGDPARDIISEQLNRLDGVIYHRMEDIPSPDKGLPLR